MAADEDTKGAGKTAGSGDAGSGTGVGSKSGDNRAGERRQREPRQRPPVTIDLKAEEVRAAPAAATATAKPATETKPESSEKPAHSGNAGAAKAEAVEAPGVAHGSRPQSERPATVTPPPPSSLSAGRAAFANMDDSVRRTAIAAVAGGVVALILVIVLQAIGILPAPGRSAANEAAEQARAAAAATAAMERQLTAIEAMVEGLPAMRADIGKLGDTVAALRTENATFAAKSEVEGVVGVLGQLRQRIDAMPPSASRDDLDAVAERIGRLEVAVAAGGGDSSGSEAAIASLSAKLGEAETALRSLTERLASAEAQMADLGTPQPMAGGEAAVRAIAITALRRASEGGAPFANEVDMVAALGVAGDAVAALRPFADRGVPSRATITAGFPAVADAVLSATATSDPDAGFFQRLVGGLGGLVSIRPAGPIPGDDPPAIVSRMTAAADKGDLAVALAEREGLPEAGRQASAEWAATATDRVALDELVERIARALGGVGSG